MVNLFFVYKFFYYKHYFYRNVFLKEALYLKNHGKNSFLNDEWTNGNYDWRLSFDDIVR